MLKFWLIACIAMLGSVLQTYSQQKVSGFYLTADDFKNQKLSYASNCKEEKHRIRLNDFFGRNFITVVHRDSAFRLYKNAIWGYKISDNKVIRFQGKKELVVVSDGSSIVIYKHEVAKPPRGKSNATNFYFSKDIFSRPYLLTFSNLRKIYPDRLFFHEELDRLFRFNTELAAFDPLHKMYKVDWIFNYTTKNIEL